MVLVTGRLRIIGKQHLTGQLSSKVWRPTQRYLFQIEKSFCNKNVSKVSYATKITSNPDYKVCYFSEFPENPRRLWVKWSQEFVTCVACVDAWIVWTFHEISCCGQQRIIFLCLDNKTQFLMKLDKHRIFLGMHKLNFPWKLRGKLFSLLETQPPVQQSIQAIQHRHL